MDDVNVICWLWGTKYSIADAERLSRAVKKQLGRPHRFIVFSDITYSTLLEVKPIEDPILMARSCFCRLRMFDPWWQEKNAIKGQILSLDLDLALTGRLDDLLVTDSTFKILKGANAVNPNPFNCSVMLLRAGSHPEVWTDFSLEKANAVPFHEFPDDQGWIWHKLPNADTWQVGADSGIYGFHKPGWPQGIYNYGLPNDARIVAFIGKRKPEMYSGLSWMKKYWRDV